MCHCAQAEVDNTYFEQGNTCDHDESSELSEVSVQGLAGVLDGVGSLPVSASDSEEWEDVV
jgi:hypothetical protein